MSNIISLSSRTWRNTTSPSLVLSRLRGSLMISPAVMRRRRRQRKWKMKKNRSNKRTRKPNPQLRKGNRKVRLTILCQSWRSPARTLTSMPLKKEILAQAHRLKVIVVSFAALLIARLRSICSPTKTSNSFQPNASTRASLMSVSSQYTQLIRSLLSWPKFSRIRPRSTARQPISLLSWNLSSVSNIEPKYLKKLQELTGRSKRTPLTHTIFFLRFRTQRPTIYRRPMRTQMVVIFELHNFKNKQKTLKLK